jgi:tetratricopeptide (TPR) repeat protein
MTVPLLALLAAMAAVADGYERALALVRENRLEEARLLLAETVRGEPRRPEAHNLLGSVCDRMGRVDEAIAHYQRALALAPTSAAVLNNLGIAYLRKNDAARASDAFRRALRAEPENVSSHTNLGLALLAEHKAAEAAQHLERASRAAPEDVGIRFNLGRAYLEAGNPAGVLALFDAAQAGAAGRVAEIQLLLGTAAAQLERLEPARRYLENAVRLAPESPEPFFRLGLVLQKGERWEEARAALESAVARNPAPSPEYDLALGEVYHRLGRDRDARPRLEAAARSATVTGLPRYHETLASVLASLGDWGPALEALRAAAKLAPDRPELYFRMGLLVANAGAPGAALELLRRAAERFPRSATLEVGMGQACLAGDRLEAAEEHLLAAIRLDPAYDEPYFLLGNCYQEMRRPDAAIAEYRKAVARGPARADFRLALGMALAKSGKAAEALAELEGAAQLAPSAEVFQRIAALRLDHGALAEAEAAAAKAVALDPDHAESRYLLFRVYARRGNAAGAAVEKERFDALKRAGEARPSAAAAPLKPVEYYLAFLPAR